MRTEVIYKTLTLRQHNSRRVKVIRPSFSPLSPHQSSLTTPFSLSLCLCLSSCQPPLSLICCSVSKSLQMSGILHTAALTPPAVNLTLWLWECISNRWWCQGVIRVLVSPCARYKSLITSVFTRVSGWRIWLPVISCITGWAWCVWFCESVSTKRVSDWEVQLLLQHQYTLAITRLHRWMTREGRGRKCVCDGVQTGRRDGANEVKSDKRSVVEAI